MIKCPTSMATTNRTGPVIALFEDSQKKSEQIQVRFEQGLLKLGEYLETKSYYPPSVYLDGIPHGGSCYEVVAITEDNPEDHYCDFVGFRLKLVREDHTATPYHFGAIGDMVADDTVAVQALFNCLTIGHIGRADFQSGRFLVTEKLLLNGKRGFSVVGNGVSGTPTLTPTPNLPQLPAAIVWGGADGGDMIECRCGEFIWDSVSLWGKKIASQSTSAGRLFHLLPTPGIGTGIAHFKTWFSTDAAIHFECGDAAGSSNSADLRFDKAVFRRASTCFKANSGQNVNYSFGQLEHWYSDNMFHFQGGGALNVEHWHGVGTGRYLWLDSQSNGIGRGNSKYRVSMLRVDDNLSVTPEIVFTTFAPETNVVIESLMMNPNRAQLADGRFLFTLERQTNLTVRNAGLLDTSKFSILKMLNCSNAFTSTAIFENCNIAGIQLNPILPTNWTNLNGFCDLPSLGGIQYQHVIFRDCMNGAGRLLPELRLN